MKKNVNIQSWNVNGLRAVLKKNFMEHLETSAPDILGVQETKLQEEQIPAQVRAPLGYHSAWNFAEKKGYSGTALFSRQKPRYIKTEFDRDVLNGEGRIIEAGFDGFVLFNIYFPNGKQGEARLNFKLKFYDACLDYFNRLRAEGKRVIVMGDVNTAHKEIDLKNPKANSKYSGFLPVERAWLDKFVSEGYVDTFRHFNKEPHHYSWWSYRMNAREKNVGWRIDYFFVSDDLTENLKDAYILSDVLGSDHCPVGLKIAL